MESEFNLFDDDFDIRLFIIILPECTNFQNSSILYWPLYIQYVFPAPWQIFKG